MIKFEQAYKIVISSSFNISSERIHYLQSLGHVLSENILSDMDMPPFDKSAMDGYACRYNDILDELKVVEVIQAGNIPKEKIGTGQCAKIMTGAMIPDGADCVIMVEDTIETKHGFIKFTKKIPDINLCEIGSVDKRKLNICYRAEDIKKNEVVIEKGTIIKAQHIATMASVGCTKVLVAVKPKVAIIPSGSEIVEPEIKPSVSQIRNSNASQLIAQLKNIGIDAAYYGIARDTEKSTIELINKAYEENDVIILTGGVSKGDFDLVPEILEKLGFHLLFQEIAVQPGKPTVFGKRSNKYCFGLPGNPVSGFVQFELLVKPFIFKLMGSISNPVNIALTLGKNFRRKQDNRLAFIPVTISAEGEAIPVEYHGSAHINGFDIAWGLMYIPIGTKEIKKGEKVNVRQI
jgi:molybdopterin molybdotransferase